MLIDWPGQERNWLLLALWVRLEPVLGLVPGPGQELEQVPVLGPVPVLGLAGHIQR